MAARLPFAPRLGTFDAPEVGAKGGRVPARGTLLVAAGLVLLGDAVAVSLHQPAVTPVHALGQLPHPAAVAPVGRPGPNPTAVRIPSIGVSTTLVRLGLTAKGALQVPTDFAKAGWWTGGARPGDAGTAVIVGHIDSYTGSAVFYRLRELKPRQQVEVARTDGTRAVFAVDARREFSKEKFPAKTVYGATRTASLRLITCGGAFDEKTRSYDDNVVVFAHLVRIVKAPK